ncbi:hypothetical protein TNIN_118961 [Trichonephila inaurata madagascariensis]|uniref:Uncharacterized protein n=1 Tax=Trichonephila inaurata madagascariensis TaxID=2747483 RepID=A0A8X7CLY6_9ARAC|nr:hypothetical protein TNIN_118961 [Trichonephila inaurata madagascariensis]
MGSSADRVAGPLQDSKFSRNTCTLGGTHVHFACTKRCTIKKEGGLRATKQGSELLAGPPPSCQGGLSVLRLSAKSVFFICLPGANERATPQSFACYESTVMYMGLRVGFMNLEISYKTYFMEFTRKLFVPVLGEER